MDYAIVRQYALENASQEFGSDILQTINNKSVSSAAWRLNFIVKKLQTLSDLFEVQNIASIKEELNHVVEFHNDVKDLLDGSKEFGGILTSIKQYFWNQEFKRDPFKKKAAALYLKHYTLFIRDNIQIISTELFLQMLDTVNLNGRYFDKEKVFGDILELLDNIINNRDTN